jgi:hypothetical protein
MPALRRGVLVFAAAVIAPIIRMAAPARAADVPVIRVFPPQCEAAPLSVDEFVDSLRVELAGRQPHCCVVGPGGDGAADAIRVALAIEPCDPATTQVGVAVDVAEPPRTVERTVSLADLPPEARPRALALAVAELIRSAGVSAQPEAPPPPPAPPPPAPSPPPVTLIGGVVGTMHRHFAHDTTLWGLRLGVSLGSARWQATLEAGAASSRTEVAIGDLSIFQATASLFVGPRLFLGPITASAGPAGTLGWARIEGQPTTTTTMAISDWALISTAGLRAAAEGPVAGVVRVLGYVEGGYTLRYFDAKVNDQTAAGISGGYLLVALGLRFGPS